MRAMCLPAARAIIIWVIGASSPPLTPCSTRKKINEFADQASPHKAEDTVKAPKHHR